MIGYLRGTVANIFSEYCFIDVQGIGYRVFTSAATLQNLATGAEVTLFTYLHVRDDALLLYGFATRAEYELFMALTSVNGIGPKAAIGVLSAVAPEEFCAAVSCQDISVLTKIPGIGKKTAERIILELKDKVGLTVVDQGNAPATGGLKTGRSDDILTPALEALIALGYTQSEILPVMRRHTGYAAGPEELIKLALRELGGASR